MSQVRHAKHARVDTAIGSARLESGDGSRTTSTRPSADSQQQQTGSTAGGLESRREVESARKQLVASTKELSKQINETLLDSVFRRSKLARRFTPVRLEQPVLGGRGGGAVYGRGKGGRLGLELYCTALPQLRLGT